MVHKHPNVPVPLVHSDLGLAFDDLLLLLDLDAYGVVELRSLMA